MFSPMNKRPQRAARKNERAIVCAPCSPGRKNRVTVVGQKLRNRNISSPRQKTMTAALYKKRRVRS